MIVAQTITPPWYLVGVISTGDGKWAWVPDYPGEVLSVGGFLKTLGTSSGGSTGVQVQLRNATAGVDILSTVGLFNVSSGYTLANQVVNVNNASFSSGDVIWLDVDVAPSSAADGRVWALVSLEMADV